MGILQSHWRRSGVLVATAAILMLLTVAAHAQQVTGTLGSPSATTTVSSQ